MGAGSDIAAVRSASSSRVRRRDSDAAFDRVERLEEFARERGRSLLEVAVAGLASQAGIVSVIAGATTPHQVRANAAAGEWELEYEVLDLLLRVAA